MVTRTQMVQEKRNYVKSFFFYLYKRTIFEYLVQEETNAGTSGFTFHNPFTNCKWVLEIAVQNISFVEDLPRPFGFPTGWLASGYVYIKDTNFCNYKFCSSRFSKISPLKFPPRLQSFISNDLQNFVAKSFIYVSCNSFPTNFYHLESASKRRYLHVNKNLFLFQFIFLSFRKERKIHWKNFLIIGISAKNSHKVTWQLFPEATRLQICCKNQMFKSLFHKIPIENIILRSVS